MILELGQPSTAPQLAFDVPVKERTHLTHGVHRFTAKFVPQLARFLIERYSAPNELILDPFMGSGTTVLEALLAGRRATGFDINPLCELIARVKCCPVEPKRLAGAIGRFSSRLNDRQRKRYLDIPSNDLVHEWFPPYNVQELGRIRYEICATQAGPTRSFFACAFSHILKNTSIWLEKATKPHRDPHKQPRHAYDLFWKHLLFMQERNNQLFQLLRDRRLPMERAVHLATRDSRELPLANDRVDVIITSPPYAGSYDYVCRHTGSW